MPTSPLTSWPFPRDRRVLAAALLLVGALGCATAPPPLPPPSERALSGAAHVTFGSTEADGGQTPSPALEGWLFKPRGSGPFPAVVGLHGCSGLYGSTGDLTPHFREWAERMAALGYIVLLPDSFTPRGLSQTCTRDQAPNAPHLDRARDAYEALQYLQRQTFVRPEAVALLGWSDGATATLAALASHAAERPSPLAHGFRIGIAFYPRCQPSLDAADWMPPSAPVHVLIGELDDWTPAPECAELVQRARAAGAKAELVLYPGAYHDFDDPSMPVHVWSGLSAVPSGRATVGSNPQARADSLERVTRLLRSALDAR